MMEVVQYENGLVLFAILPNSHLIFYFMFL